MTESAATRRQRKQRTERIIECEDRIGRLTAMMATMDTERLRLLAEVITLRMKEDA